jgi:hypothetical protein
MSAQLCSIRTINALANFAKLQRVQIQLNAGDYLDAAHQPQFVADMLLGANLASLRTKYPQDWQAERAITYQAADPRDLAPVLVLKTAQYFNFQACETPDYYDTDAAALVRAILEKAIRALPGYDAAPWGLDGDDPAEVQPAPVKAKQGDLMAMIFPEGPITDDGAPITRSLNQGLQPITRATLSSMGPTKVSGNAQWAAKTGDPMPAPKQQPKKQPKPNDNEQPDGPF